MEKVKKIKVFKRTEKDEKEDLPPSLKCFTRLYF